MDEALGIVGDDSRCLDVTIMERVGASLSTGLAVVVSSSPHRHVLLHIVIVNGDVTASS